MGRDTIPVMCCPGLLVAASVLSNLANDIPLSWNMADIQREAGPGEAYVLAWQIVANKRGFRVEECLVLTKGKQWYLSHLERDANSRWWTLGRTHCFESGGFLRVSQHF
jgi:hypothetical protein